MKNGLLLVLMSLLVASCDKAIDLQPENKEALLVVDGTIENGMAPVITLSNSLNFYSAITPKMLSESLVQNAIVTLSDGVQTYPLVQYSQPIGGGFSIYYYSSDTTNAARFITGKQGTTYTLNIVINNLQYTATTTIPVLSKQIDSLWWKPAPQNEDTNKATIMVRVTDPKGYGNYIRYFTKVSSGSYLPGANSAFDDQIVDGTTYDIQVDQGINRNDPPEDEEYGYFKLGDTATVKFCNTDKATYDFWRTLEYSYQSVGNPFASPTKVLGNVSNGALGAFCGYAAQYKTLIIRR